MNIPKKTKKIQVICPICKSKDVVGIPELEINSTSQLKTISIHKGLICPHHFQIFLDKNFQIRGYQKVDLELNQKNSIKLRNGVKAFSQIEKDNTNLFEKLILEGNTVKCRPLNSVKSKDDSYLKQEIISKSKKMTLKEIYEEFWEFIEEDNEKFYEFIINDKRRKNSSINSNLNEIYNHIELNQEI